MSVVLRTKIKMKRNSKLSKLMRSEISILKTINKLQFVKNVF